MNAYWVVILSVATVVGCVKMLKRSRQQDRAERRERTPEPMDLDRSFMQEMAEVAKHIENLYHKQEKEG